MNLNSLLAILGTNLMWFSGILNKLITDGKYAHPIGIVFMFIAILTIAISLLNGEQTQ